MKQVLLGVGITLAVAALLIAGRIAYVEAEIKGCVKFSVISIEMMLGKMPEQYKAAAMPGIELACRQALL